jgi:membrane associated rhomboid family serine protease
MNVVVPIGQHVHTGTRYIDKFPWYTMMTILLYIVLYTNIPVGSKEFDALSLRLSKSKQSYRWYSYSYIHGSDIHLATNIILYIVVSIPIEYDNFIWRTFLIQFFSIIGGACGPGWEQRLLQPDTKITVVGASGGIYGMLASISGNLILNWSELPMYKRLIYISMLSCMVTSDVVVSSIFPNPSISYSCHMGGFIAGTFAGICCMKNIKVLQWERRLRIASGSVLSIYIFMGAINLFTL